MDSSPSEMQKARNMSVVARVTLSSDFSSVVVDLCKDESLGLISKNTLLFPAQTFSIDQIEEVIRKIARMTLSASIQTATVDGMGISRISSFVGDAPRGPGRPDNHPLTTDTDSVSWSFDRQS